MICLLCEEEIEDGEYIIEGQVAKAVVRDEEDEWTGECDFGSRIYSCHEDCFTEVEGDLSE